MVDEVLRSDAGMELLLGVPFYLGGVASGDAATGRATLPSRLRLIVTEYNVMERAGPIKLSWAHALFMAAGALTLLGVPQVDAALLHVLLNGWGWGGLYDTTNDFQLGGVPPPGSAATAVGNVGCLIPECSGLNTTAYAPTAVGSALGALALAMRGAARAEPLAFDGAPTRRGARPGGLPGKVDYPSLLGFRFYDGAGIAHNATVLNLGPNPLRANVSCARATSLVSPDPSGSVAAWATNERPVRSEVRSCDAAGVELPPYSVSVVSL